MLNDEDAGAQSAGTSDKARMFAKRTPDETVCGRAT
jgi:hypothetical protein